MSKAAIIVEGLNTEDKTHRCAQGHCVRKLT